MPSPYHTGQVMPLIFFKYTTIPGYFATMDGKERIDFWPFVTYVLKSPNMIHIGPSIGG
jgi:hypothetical protein